MEVLRVGGVPEHFNLPWHLGIENGIFEKQNLRIDWITFHGGTGQMTKALRDLEVDVCVVLTEGIIADIIHGNPSRIISKYLNTPLIWGIFSGIHNPINYYGEIYTKKYAISRFGSGSHLMPIVDALFKEKELEKDQFHVVKNLTNALNSLDKNETDVFYWEKYTTKPYVDEGRLKCLGEFVTPWPCFVLAATDEVIKTKPEVLAKMLNTLYFINKQFMTAVDSIEQVSLRYKQDLKDVKNWFHSTEWSTNDEVSLKSIENVIYTLERSGIISQALSPNDICKKVI